MFIYSYHLHFVIPNKNSSDHTILFHQPLGGQDLKSEDSEVPFSVRVRAQVSADQYLPNGP